MDYHLVMKSTLDMKYDILLNVVLLKESKKVSKGHSTLLR